MEQKTLFERLSGRIHEHDILEILYYAQEDSAVARHLYEAVFDEDLKIARNALWVLTWEQIDILLPKRSELVEFVLKAEDVTLRRLTMTLLERMPWEQEDVRADFLDFCIERIISPTEKPGVRSLAIKLTYAQSRYYPELLLELRTVLDSIAEYPLPPAVKCSRKNILKKMEAAK